MTKARHYVKKDTLVTLYYSFIYPYYIYCNHVWGCASVTNINRLFVLQKWAVRIICQARWRAHSDPLFRELKLLNIWQINKFLIGQFMFRCYHQILPALFDTYFTRINTVHEHQTRQALSQFKLDPVKTEYRKTCIRFRGPSIWNEIMKNKICPDVTICTFKFHLKKLLLDGKL